MCGNLRRDVVPMRIIIKKQETEKENSALPEKFKVNYICQKRHVDLVGKVHWQNKYK
jgi:hypothetical protein